MKNTPFAGPQSCAIIIGWNILGEYEVIRRIMLRAVQASLVSVALVSCSADKPAETTAEALTIVEPRPDIYAEFTLTADLSYYTDNQREMIGLLIEASQIMEDLFWRQAYGDDYEAWLASIGVDDTRRFADQNYGPWDRLNNNMPFIEGVGAKPPGANFYPADMTREEFDAAYLPGKTGQYSLIRRKDSGELVVIPYHVAYADEIGRAHV